MLSRARSTTLLGFLERSVWAVVSLMAFFAGCVTTFTLFVATLCSDFFGLTTFFGWTTFLAFFLPLAAAGAGDTVLAGVGVGVGVGVEVDEVCPDDEVPDPVLDEPEPVEPLPVEPLPLPVVPLPVLDPLPEPVVPPEPVPDAGSAGVAAGMR
jgi:hypothetical protein